uniref:Uncharacterized protein n=1 Tax=viral metagenome TaxID=1070528 RepID=A0A6M3IWY3_9ZZZZ
MNLTRPEKEYCLAGQESKESECASDNCLSYFDCKYRIRNQALNDMSAYQNQQMEGLEELITNSSLSKALGDKYIKNHKGAEFGVFVWDKAITDLATKIREIIC